MERLDRVEDSEEGIGPGDDPLEPLWAGGGAEIAGGRGDGFERLDVDLWEDEEEVQLLDDEAMDDSDADDGADEPQGDEQAREPVTAGPSRSFDQL